MKRKREICERCERPTPAACVCQSLPCEPLTLSNARIIILQHPNERKRKNSSLPLVELSLFSDCWRTDDKPELPKEDFTMYKSVARWWGEQAVHPEVWKIVNNQKEPVLLCFPSEDAISIEDAIQRMSINTNTLGKDQQCSLTAKQNLKRKINIIFIDATWKFAKEMDSKTVKNGGWPSQTLRVQISNFGEDFKPKRFDIRTPPSQTHLSTAECIAQTLKVIEDNGTEIFDILMKPLDLMVQQWHSFSDKKKKE